MQRKWIDGMMVEFEGREANIAAIIKAADDEGTLQAEDAVALFPGQPQAHTTQSMADALARVGARIIDD